MDSLHTLCAQIQVSRLGGLACWSLVPLHLVEADGFAMYMLQLKADEVSTAVVGLGQS